MAADAHTNHSGLEPEVDFDLDRAAIDLHIPRNEWTNPVFHELIGFVVRVDALQQDLFAAVGARAHEQLPGFLDGTHPLAARYATAEHLLRVIAALLREGLSFWETRQVPGSANFRYFVERLDNALQPYELRAAPRSSTPDGDQFSG